MPFTWQIIITKNPDGKLAYEPKTLGDVSVGDQIIWTNNDDSPHWPGAKDNPAYFMANQIAPHSPSTTFLPSAVGTLSYSDSLTAGDAGGTIVVVS